MEPCLTQAEVDQVVGKTIKAVVTGEYWMEITFTDGTALWVEEQVDGLYADIMKGRE